MGGPLRHCFAFTWVVNSLLVSDELSQLRQLLKYHEFVVRHSIKIACHVTAIIIFIVASVECDLFHLVESRISFHPRLPFSSILSFHCALCNPPIFQCTQNPYRECLLMLDACE